MRILIADDSVLLRQGLVLILQDAGHEVVAEVGDGDSLVEAALRLRPDLVISDIRMPPSHADEGLRAAMRIRACWPGAPVLLLSQYVVAAHLPELLGDGEGGIGYLLKDRVTQIEEFLAAALRVARGELVLDPDVVARTMRRGRRRDPLEDLTPREREVLQLMAEGRTNASIAEMLVISEGAVEKHTQRIFAKLGLLPDAAVHRRVKAVLTMLSA
ncbi:response regulator transcription factor [Schaalia sp. 19OD2882]|uniref:response regulator transcription factor n=1 Tax=Schaalia sp. 19OD2882 TaxID=2794089 RepID=UPI001C1E8DBD|nr:response regulator transcription factor [Schaalia sp. 19OD2882]QWW19896.1 response regulator transcription factor [Schaalia sp. 19OD2882]